jgi:hypothetical protein
VFFSPTSKKKRINHVGIYLNDGQFIHAESNRGIIISSIEDEHWRDRLVSAKGLDGKKVFTTQDTEEWTDPDEQDEQDTEARGLQVRYSSNDKPRTQPPVALSKSSSRKQQQFIELAYIRPVFGKYCNLQLGSFREDFDVYGGASADMAEAAHDPYGAYALYSYTQGIRIASDIRPFQWMSITPNFMYYSQGRELENYYLPSRSLGVDMILGSLPDSGWSMSTGLKYETLSTSALRRATRTGDPSQIDLSFTYSQQLSRRTQLSLMGQSLRSSFAQHTEEPGASSNADQRVFFMLNYNY